MIKKLLGAGLTALCLAATGGAQAAVVSSSDNSFGFSWDYDTGSSHLTGLGSMTVNGFNTSALSLSISLTNTSLLGGQGGERLTAFGFGIDPNATGVSFFDSLDAGMINAVMGATFPAVKTVEICSFGGSNCAGGGNGGIYGGGASDSFVLMLAGSWGGSVTIDPLAFKYQTGYGSFEFTNEPPRKVPEPASGALLLLGVLLLAAGSASRLGGRSAPVAA